MEHKIHKAEFKLDQESFLILRAGKFSPAIRGYTYISVSLSGDENYPSVQHSLCSAYFGDPL